ncbi:hypothetical protein B0A52_02354 [Exophiala mesophila]|uniref:Uncharacterized protein n=1 Tax=Exophiala mesophila TaxID=212818 RepID=A0A438NBS1_EXOME|nr:hypothetical protein B0A52_02354 [Exophiala mesophila]
MTTDKFYYSHEILEKPIGEVNIKSSAMSVVSTDSTTPTLVGGSSFKPGATLDIAARGIGTFRFPLPSSELEILVYHSDGTLAYTSTRAKRSSGNSVLSHAKLGDLISTTYKFGPNREPVLRLMQSPGHEYGEEDEVKVKGRWTSRATSFSTPDGRTFDWSYAKSKDANGKRVNLIALRESSGSEEPEGKILAQLVRGQDSRTPGSSRCTAGNGGQLIFDQDATSIVDESLIVATCLMMLKKEIDRRRATQMAIIMGAASGGS